MAEPADPQRKSLAPMDRLQRVVKGAMPPMGTAIEGYPLSVRVRAALVVSALTSFRVVREGRALRPVETGMALCHSEPSWAVLGHLREVQLVRLAAPVKAVAAVAPVTCRNRGVVEAGVRAGAGGQAEEAGEAEAQA